VLLRSAAKMLPEWDKPALLAPTTMPRVAWRCASSRLWFEFSEAMPDLRELAPFGSSTLSTKLHRRIINRLVILPFFQGGVTAVLEQIDGDLDSVFTVLLHVIAGVPSCIRTRENVPR